MKTYKAYQTITLKHIIVLLVMIIVSYGCGRSIERIEESQVQFRTGLAYKIKSKTPYTGIVNGVHSNEQKTVAVATWYENGQKKRTLTYKDGKTEITDTRWYNNGQKSQEDTYKDGKIETATYWYKHGPKKMKDTWKDGKKEGPVTTWYKNGQKKSEGTYKDGEVIDRKRWDEEGNIKK